MSDSRATLVRVNAGVNVEGELFVHFATPTAHLSVFLTLDEAEALSRKLTDAIERVRRRANTGGDGR